MGERKAWTARGEVQETDKAVIQALVDKNLVAARIFVTGEVHESYIGDAATRLLVNINDTLYKDGVEHEPLFVQTRDDTVRMTRFDPAVVWRCFHPDTLVKLIEEESARLHVDMDPLGMEHFDFYEELASVIRKKTGNAVPIAWKDSDLDAYYSAVYLSCLLVFGKSGYLDIPVAQYFAQPVVADWMAKVDYRLLTVHELNKLEDLGKEYCRIQSLTNPELNFIISLYERNRA